MAMLHIALRLNLPIDEVNYADVGFGAEFDEQYEYIARMEQKLRIPVNHLKSDTHTAENIFYGYPSRGQFSDQIRGFCKVLGGCRYRSWLKTDLLDKRAGPGDVIHIGYAVDETRRLQSSEYTKGDIGRYRFDLMEMGMTEAECYTYVQSGELYNPLYEYFSGLGCFWCPKAPMPSMRRLYWHFPGYWANLRKMQEDQGNHRPYTTRYTVGELEEKFQREREKGCICHLPPPHQCQIRDHLLPLAFLQRKERLQKAC